MKPQNFKVLLDMDGVLADLVPHFVSLVNKYYGVDLKREDVVNYEFHKAHCDLTPEIYKFFGQSGFFRHLDPMPGAIESLEYLLDKDYDVSIVTACLKGGHDDKREWFQDHLTKEAYEKIKFKINFTHEHHFFQGNILVDDHTENLTKFSEHNTLQTNLAICFDARYNQDWQGTRAMNWEECVDLIDDHYNWLSGKKLR